MGSTSHFYAFIAVILQEWLIGKHIETLMSCKWRLQDAVGIHSINKETNKPRNKERNRETKKKRNKQRKKERKKGKQKQETNKSTSCVKPINTQPDL